MEDFIFYIYEFSASFILFLITMRLFHHIHKKQKLQISKSYSILMMLFACYLIGVYHFTGAGTIYEAITFQLEIREDSINLIPFSNDIVAYLLNIVLLIPLGIFVPILWEKASRWSAVAGIGFLFSVFIEITQLINNRQTDIDDVILNTSGAIIGFIIYKICSPALNQKFQQNSVTVTELPTYILILFAGRFLLFNEMGLAKLLYHF
ncbi:MAG: VanZ family protein [Oscillospiraceae bacterium]|nr:VanZ family protein [Oscillospiraceae bacterium]